jgi:hypothetical protein
VAQLVDPDPEEDDHAVLSEEDDNRELSRARFRQSFHGKARQSVTFAK